MNAFRKSLLATIAVGFVAGPLFAAVQPSREELRCARRWADARFGQNGGEPPFSFVYAGKPSSGFLKSWNRERSEEKIDRNRRRFTLSYTDPATGLVLRCEGVRYNDYPTVEWTVHLKNTGAVDSPIISDIQALDTTLERDSQGEFTLHHFNGTTVSAEDYRPFETILGPKENKSFISRDGRPCGTSFPYFNLAWPGRGVIIVVGWPGQWAARFERDEGTAMRVAAGLESMRFKLLPGEEVRTPLIVMQFYTGDWIRAQNIWRRWMIAHNVPRPGGKLPPPQMTPCSSHQFAEMINANEENQKLFIDRYLEEGLKLDYWWMDAGWYICGGAWQTTGTWEVDTQRFPRGLRAISDHAHKKGVKIITWFEPERVAPDTWIQKNHPEWLFGIGLYKLLNLGNPDALQWLTDHIDRLITEQGIDLYRQDFNIDPLSHWRSNDSEDRQGITEIKYVTGYLAYWDELRRRHRDMLIDSCASGGHRNDLESMRRAIPLLRSDYIFEPVGQQCHTYGLSFWLPFHGTGVKALDAYGFRSTMCSGIIPCWDVRRTDIDYGLLRRLTTQWREIASNYYGDYYPLTPYSLDNSRWIVWQFDRPEAGRGVVQAFRRADCADDSITVNLRGLDPKASYSLTDVDTDVVRRMNGEELMIKGIEIRLTDKPAAAVITYRGN
ncbi:MAG: alpha-galactosidase [Armatimonadetes bacterium]|nr:alpha-galactosidase [Armatimonadota bacterium]